MSGAAYFVLDTFLLSMVGAGLVTLAYSIRDYLRARRGV